jgi:RNA polymerase sigma-70 factor (ECF subfamily)
MHDRLDEFDYNLKKYKTKLLANLYSITNHKSDIEDIFQRASVTMWKKYDTFETGTSFYSWAFKILKYELFNFARSAKRNPVVCDDSVFTAVSVSVMVEDPIRNTDLLIKLEAAMDRLSESSRKLVHMVYVEGVDIGTAAKMVGRSRRTCYNKISQIRQLLLKSINAQ